ILSRSDRRSVALSLRDRKAELVCDPPRALGYPVAERQGYVCACRPRKVRLKTIARTSPCARCVARGPPPRGGGEWAEGREPENPHYSLAPAGHAGLRRSAAEFAGFGRSVPPICDVAAMES